MTEKQFQKKCVAWFRYEFPQYSRLLFKANNEEFISGTNVGKDASEWMKIQARQRGRNIGRHKQAEGIVSGVADLFLSVPAHYEETVFDDHVEFCGLYTELKTGNNDQSYDQYMFEKEVLKQGYAYEMCWPYSDTMITKTHGSLYGFECRFDEIYSFTQVIKNYLQEPTTTEKLLNRSVQKEEIKFEDI